MNWNDLKVFIAVVEEGGLKSAARKLGMHHSSCARKLKMLEHDLKVKLFERRRAEYKLTKSGEKLFNSTSVIRNEVNSIESNIIGRDQEVSGDLRLTLPNGFATHLLMPDLSRFMDTYPKINLDVQMTYEYRDLEGREADVAIRHIENPPDSLFGRQVAKIFSSAYAHKDYLKDKNPIEHPESCHWLGWWNKANHAQWPGKENFIQVPIRGQFYSDILQLAAIKSCAGIASLPCYMADPEPDLQRIPGVGTYPQDTIWVLSHKNMASNARVRTLMAFLVEAFKAHQDKLEGLHYS